jgi:hypothetical protein
VKVRVLLSVALFIIGIGLPIAALSTKGPPWGFRGHRCVLLDATGDVEVKASDMRAQREGLEEAALKETPGLRLDDGDVVRVGRFSEARLRMPNADIELHDGSRVTIGDGRLIFGRGLGRVRVTPGARPLKIEIDGTDATVTVQPGVTTIASDAKGTFIAYVEQGSAQLSSSKAGDISAQESSMLHLTKDGRAEEVPAPTTLSFQATCDGARQSRVKGTAPRATQLFAFGQLVYPDTDGSFAIETPGLVTEAFVFARDPAGNTATKVLACAAPPPPTKNNR